MKKILLLTLVFLQTILFAQTTPSFKNIKITGNVNDPTAVKINVQSTNGVVNTIAKADVIDYLEYPTAASLPVTGVVAKIYCTTDDNNLYRWNGTIYTPFSDADVDLSGIQTQLDDKVDLGSDQTITGNKTIASNLFLTNEFDNPLKFKNGDFYTSFGFYEPLTQDHSLSFTDKSGILAVMTDINLTNVLLGGNAAPNTNIFFDNTLGGGSGIGYDGIQFSEHSSGVTLGVNLGGLYLTKNTVSSFQISDGFESYSYANIGGIINGGTKGAIISSPLLALEVVGAEKGITVRTDEDDAISAQDGFFAVDVQGNVNASSLRTNVYFLVFDLPTDLPIGSMCFVADALAPTYLSPVVGGGSTLCPVFWDGTVWRCH